MSVLSVDKVSHSYGGRQILEDASFRLNKGEHVGLVGANGEGKTTFLNIITGELMPDSGNISWCNHISTGYLDQRSTLEAGKTIMDVLRDAFSKYFDLEKEMLAAYDEMATADEERMERLMESVGEIQDILDHSGFYTIDAKIQEFAAGLGVKELGLDTDVSELSGGQRTKVLLTKLLLENPMILILDEPTNYLDENHIIWLTRFLKEYENAFILVSHDIPFLNDVVNVIYHVEDAILTRYTGNYDDFMQMYELKKRQLEAAYNKQQKEIADMKEFIARNKARIATSNMAKSRQKKLDKMDIIELSKEKPKAEFRFLYSRAPGKYVIEAENLVIGYDKALTPPLNFHVDRGAKIAIKGVNGIGKSTLLKTMLGVINPFDGSVKLDYYAEPAYFEQEHAGSSKTTLEEFWNEFPSLTNSEARRALAKCGLTTEHIESQVKVLSGGENAKFRLCKLMQKPMNLLVLDEPTNHLDPASKDALREAVDKFEGTVILVSHEPEFYEGIVSDIWNLEDWVD